MNTLKRLAMAAGTMALLVTSTVANPVYQSTEFWSAKHGVFDVKGYHKGADGNPVCQLNVRYGDGSYFSLVRDLVDGEVWMELSNKTWNAYGETFRVQWNFHNKNGSVNFSQEGTANIIDTTTIQFRWMNNGGQLTPEMDTFLNLFQSSYAISFYEKADHSHIFTLPLGGSRKAFKSVVDCISHGDMLMKSDPA